MNNDADDDTRNHDQCDVVSFENTADSFEACPEIMETLSSFGWGKDELSSLKSLRSGHSSLQDMYSSLSSAKFGAPGCVGLDDFYFDVKAQYSSLMAEASVALRLLTSAVDGGNSAAMTRAVCAMKDIQRVTSRVSTCEEVKSVISGMTLNVEASLSQAKSMQSKIMSLWKGGISCPSPTTTDWNYMGGNPWWLPLDLLPHKKTCIPPKISKLPQCTRIDQYPKLGATSYTYDIPNNEDAHTHEMPKRAEVTELELNKKPTYNEYKYSCDCGDDVKSDIFPSYTGKNCGKSLFCPNEVPAPSKAAKKKTQKPRMMERDDQYSSELPSPAFEEEPLLSFTTSLHDLDAKSATIFGSGNAAPTPGSTPQHPPKDTATPPLSSSPIKLNVVDKASTGYSTLSDLETAEPSSVGRLQRDTEIGVSRKATTSQGVARRKTHFLQGPPKHLRSISFPNTRKEVQELDAVNRELRLLRYDNC